MIQEEVIEFFKNVPPFQFLDEKTLASIAGKLAMEFYPKDTIILKQDDKPSEYLRVIKKGGIKVVIRSDDEDMVVDFRGEGDNFGLWSIIERNKQKTTVIAVDDTICYLIPKDIILKLLDTSAVFTEYFLKSHMNKYADRIYGDMLNNTFYGGTDRILFTTRVGDIAIKDVISVRDDATIQATAVVMAKKGISSIIVLNDQGQPTGILTDRDLREKVVARGRDVHEPVTSIMSPPLIRVDANDYCFEAVLKMIKHNIHHILVVKDGVLRGVLTNHDFMILQGGSPLTFAKDIENQQSIEGLVPVSGKVNKIITLLLKEGAKASNITRIISELNDRLVKKVLEIAEKKFGRPPVPYCWIAYGSEGRKEQTFKTDQDNALIYADPADEAEGIRAVDYFPAFATFVNDSLIRVGFPSCPANFMAKNPRWCQPLSVWEKYFSGWVRTPNPEAILKSLILFDFRPLHGEFKLAEDLRSYLINILKDQNVFFAKMASVITVNRPPLGFFKTFVVEKDGEHKDELNLKLRGIGPLIDMVRLFALESGVRETSTIERIKAMTSINPFIIELGDEIEQSFDFITLLRIHHQLDQMEQGLPTDNFVNPSNLSNLERKSLKDAFHVILKIQDAIGELHRMGMVN
ncbi:MAG: DUF294 nucleotidyltransferase-like domain-containing protein [Thermodesulfovibrionales bacterium]